MKIKRNGIEIEMTKEGAGKNSCAAGKDFWTIRVTPNNLSKVIKFLGPDFVCKALNAKLRPILIHTMLDNVDDRTGLQNEEHYRIDLQRYFLKPKVKSDVKQRYSLR